MKVTGHQPGLPRSKDFCHNLLSGFFSLVIIIAAFHVPISLAINLSLGGLHPSEMLTSLPFTNLPKSASSTSAASRLNSAARVSGTEIQEDEVLYHLYRNGLSRNDYRKPSTKFMVNLFNELQRGVGFATGLRSKPVTDTIRSFSGQNLKTTRKGKLVIDFHIPYLPPHERLRYAEIRFLRSQEDSAKSEKYKFRIEMKKGGKTVNKVSLHELSVVQRQYNIFDMTTVLSPWINDCHGNISLYVKLSKKLHRRTFVISAQTFQSTSLIVLYLEDREFLKNIYTSFMSPNGTVIKRSTIERSPRVKRTVPGFVQASSNSSTYTTPVLMKSTGDNNFNRIKRETKKRRRRNRKVRKWYKGGRKENCKLYDFEVDFNAIGWGQWIIHPKRFNSRFCYGICPSPVDTKYKPTNHAMLQTLMRMKRPNVAPTPCCVPIKLNAVSMLYFEYDEIVVRHHEDMVAEECGCR